MESPTSANSLPSANFLPSSAFSSYNLTKTCNYYLSSADMANNSFANADIPNKCTLSELSREDNFSPLDQEKLKVFPPAPSLFHTSPILGYPYHLHMIQKDLINNRSNVSTCGNVYGARRQRSEKKPIPENLKDDKYFERRKRNNQAAKKSRDARKLREDQVALRATILEHENAILRAQLVTIREEASSLRQMLLQKKALEIVSRDPRRFIERKIL